MSMPHTWRKEQGARVEGGRGLDLWKVQAPCITRTPDGRYRLFYTGIGPEKPFEACQGYILSAVSDQSARLLLTDPDRYPIDRLLSHARWLLGRIQ